MDTHDNDEERRLHAGRRVSLREAMLWTTGIVTCLATTYWLEMSSLLIFFYGTLGALSWRLSKAMPFNIALVIALTVAMIVTAVMAPLVHP